MQQKADTRMEASLDKEDYDASQLIEIRVPLNMPYQSNWSEFQRYDGEVELDGKHYKYVKRKVENGEMVLLCLPNTDKQNLQAARDNFFKLVNDLETSAPKKKSDGGNSGAFKNLFSEYFSEQNNWSISRPASTLDAKFLDYSFFTPASLVTTPEQPPEA